MTDISFRQEYPVANLSADCAHDPGACRTCVAKHAMTEIERGVLINNASCVECQSTLSKDEIPRHIWREDWEKSVHPLFQIMRRYWPAYHSLIQNDA